MKPVTLPSSEREALNESILRLKQSGIYYRIVEKFKESAP